MARFYLIGIQLLVGLTFLGNFPPFGDVSTNSVIAPIFQWSLGILGIIVVILALPALHSKGLDKSGE